MSSWKVTNMTEAWATSSSHSRSIVSKSQWYMTGIGTKCLSIASRCLLAFASLMNSCLGCVGVLDFDLSLVRFISGFRKANYSLMSAHLLVFLNLVALCFLSLSCV